MCFGIHAALRFFFCCAVNVAVIISIIVCFFTFSFLLFTSLLFLLFLCFLWLQTITPKHIEQDREADELEYNLEESAPELDITKKRIDYVIFIMVIIQVADALCDIFDSISDEKGDNHDQVEQGLALVGMMSILINYEATKQID